MGLFQNFRVSQITHHLINCLAGEYVYYQLVEHQNNWDILVGQCFLTRKLLGANQANPYTVPDPGPTLEDSSKRKKGRGTEVCPELHNHLQRKEDTSTQDRHGISGMAVHICNSGYLGGRNRRILSLRSATLERSYLTNKTTTGKGLEGVMAQVVECLPCMPEALVQSPA